MKYEIKPGVERLQNFKTWAKKNNRIKIYYRKIKNHDGSSLKTIRFQIDSDRLTQTDRWFLLTNIFPSNIFIY